MKALFILYYLLLHRSGNEFNRFFLGLDKVVICTKGLEKEGEKTLNVAFIQLAVHML